MVRIIRDDAY